MYEPDQPDQETLMEMARCVVCVMSDTVFDVCVFYVVPTQGAFTWVCFVCVLCSIQCIHVYVSYM